MRNNNLHTVCLALLLACLLLCTILTLSACSDKNPSDNATDASSDTAAPEADGTGEGTAATEREPADSADTSATDTEPATEPVTEPETEYDIVKPAVYPELNSTNWFNAKDFGAKGDGKTDDTAAVRDTLLAAVSANGVAYFPEGKYLVTETVTLPKNDGRILRAEGNQAALVGSEGLNGPILQIDMKYNVYMYNLDFEHNGQGNCINALSLTCQFCRFSGDAENRADTVLFAGSDSRIIECSFDTGCPEAYALSYIKRADEISINDHIVDNVFRGAGMGIRVGDGDYKEDGRCEGLKINGNYFYNTGAEQIRVTEILHVNIAHNVMRNCTGRAIVLTQLGHGADGVYINDNSIVLPPEAVACIASVHGGDDYISDVNINNNILRGAQYGILDEVIFNKAFIRSNLFADQTVSGYANQEKTKISQVYAFFDNIFDEAEDVCSLTLQARGSMTFVRNSIGAKNDFSAAFEKSFPTEQINADVSGNDNHTRRDADEAGSSNEYKGEENIGREEQDASETERVMDIRIISSDPCDDDMVDGGATGAEAYDMYGGATVLVHFAATARFSSLSIICPSWGDSDGSIHATLYHWTLNYDKTLQGEPIVTADWMNFPDNTNNTLTFDIQQPGEYALLLTEEDNGDGSHVGLWTMTNAKTYMKVYKNGVLCDGLELKLMNIHYIETPEETLWEASREKSEITSLYDIGIRSSAALDADLFGTENKLSNDPLDMIGGCELMAHFAATAHFDSLKVNCPSWGNASGSIHAKLYKWVDNYETTLAGEPVASADWMNFPDGQFNQLKFPTLPAGEYALVLTVDPADGGDDVGVWLLTRKSTYMKVYKNGVLADGIELNLFSVHYTETPEILLWPASPDR